MSDLDARLTAALNEDAPPARDALFRVEVLERLERARFRRRVGLTLAVAAAAGVLVAVNAQAIGGWMATDIRLVWIVALGALAGMFALPEVRVAVSPGARTLVRPLRRLYP